MDAIVATMPKEHRGDWPEILPNGWYPNAFLSHCWTAIANEHLRGDKRAIAEFFPEMGRFIAEDNLNSVYRFLLSLLSPNRVLAMTPRLWRTYFDSVEVEVTPAPEGFAGRVVVRGLGPVPYLGLVAKGWLELAYEKCGAKVFSVDEEGWAAGKLAPEPLIFVHRWR